MEISKEIVIKKRYNYLTIKEFINRFNPPLTKESVNYLIENDKVDFMRPGNERFIVMTKKTESYKPNSYANRITKREQN